MPSLVDGTEPSDHPYAGNFMGHECALQIALGNVDLQTKQTVDHFNPDHYKVAPDYYKVAPDHYR